MRPAIAALAVFGVLATAGAVPAVGQQDRWQVRDLEGGGKEFQLPNDEGAVIILACRLQGMGAGFEFVEPIEPTQRAMVRGIPGARENIVVEPVNPVYGAGRGRPESRLHAGDAAQRVQHLRAGLRRGGVVRGVRQRHDCRAVRGADGGQDGGHEPQSTSSRRSSRSGSRDPQ